MDEEDEDGPMGNVDADTVHDLHFGSGGAAGAPLDVVQIRALPALRVAPRPTLLACACQDKSQRRMDALKQRLNSREGKTTRSNKEVFQEVG